MEDFFFTSNISQIKVHLAQSPHLQGPSGGTGKGNGWFFKDVFQIPVTRCSKSQQTRGESKVVHELSMKCSSEYCVHTGVLNI